MATPFDFDSNLHFDSETTAGAVKGWDGARYTAGARVPRADAAMDSPFILISIHVLIGILIKHRSTENR